MRIRILSAFLLLASLAGPSAEAATRCGCHHRPAPVVRRHHCGTAPRRAVVSVRHYGYLGGPAPSWGETRSWSEERSSYDGGGVVVGRRPWATDRFGYLTWPGKTHFAPPAPVEGPPAPPVEGPPGPPPWQGAQWQGPPPADWQGAPGPAVQGEWQGQGWQGPPPSAGWGAPVPQGGPPPVEWRGQGCCQGSGPQGWPNQGWSGPPPGEGWDGGAYGAEVQRF